MAISRQTCVGQLAPNIPSPFITNLCIFSTQTKSFHMLLDAILPGPVCCVPSIHCLTQSAFSLCSIGPITKTISSNPINTPIAAFLAHDRGAERTICYCPSARLSVTRVDLSKTVELRVVQFSSFSSPIPFLFVV